MMAASQSLIKPELLEVAKWIIEYMPKLMGIYELKWPPEKDCLGMTYMMSQLMH
jgi:hypothetical protein